MKGGPAVSSAANEGCPDSSLWRAVIAKSLSDATMKCSDKGYGSERVEKERAIIFLTRPSKWFDEVCDMAGLCPRQVRTLAIRKIEQSNTPGWSRTLLRKPRDRRGSVTQDSA